MFTLEFPQKNERRLSHNYYDNLVAEKENLLKNNRRAVCMHLVPASIAAKLSNDRFEVDAPTNIVKLRIDALHSPLLTQFRKDWIDFSFQTPEISRITLNEKCRQMKIKYAKLLGDAI